MAIIKGGIATAADYNALLGVPNGPLEPAPSGQVSPEIIDISSKENLTTVPTNKTIVLDQPVAAVGDFLLLAASDSNPDFQITNALAGGWTLVQRTDGLVNTDVKAALFYRYVTTVPTTYSLDITDGMATHLSITSMRNVAAAAPIAQSSISAAVDDAAITFASTTANNSIFTVLSTGKTEVSRRSVYFAIDSSGSMDWGNRRALLKQSMNNILDEIDNEITVNGLDIDIGLTSWDTNIDVKYEFISATSGNIATLKAFINSFNGHGGTDFNVALSDPAAWFNTSLGNPAIDRRIFIFVTDGENNGGPINVPTILKSDAVSSYAFNIEHTDISETKKIDNTPEDGVPVITGLNVAQFTTVLSNAIFSRRFTTIQPHDPSYTTDVSVVEHMIPNEFESPFWTHLYLNEYIGTTYTENYSRPNITGLKSVLISAEIVGKDVGAITLPSFPAAGTGFTTAPVEKFKGIYGVGYGDRGYGQTEFALNNVTVGEIMDNDTMLHLHTAITKIANHQGTAIPNLVDEDNLEDGDIITAYNGVANPNNSLVDLVVGLDAQRLVATNGMKTHEEVFKYVDTEWGRMNSTVVRFQWRNADQARYFFNAGGKLKINFSHTGNTTSGDATWGNILDNKMGTLTLDASSMTMSGTAGNQVVNTSKGFYNHTEEYITAFEDNTTTSGRRAIYFSIDASGSINTSRKNTIQQSILNVLDDLDYEIINNGLDIDLGMIFWSTSVKAKLERLAATTTNIAEFRNFIVNSYAIGGGTDFEISLPDIATFFTTSLGDADIDERILIFMSDGNHNSGGAFNTIPSVLQTDVDVFAFNIELTNTTDSAKLDNTPEDGIPILFDNNIEQFTQTISNAIFQEHYVVSLATRVPTFGLGVQSSVNGGPGNTVDVAVLYRDGTNALISTGSTITVDIVKPETFIADIETPSIVAMKQI